MTQFIFGKEITLTYQQQREPCYGYAITEATRLLGRLGVKVKTAKSSGKGFALRLTSTTVAKPLMADAITGLKSDGYAIRVAKNEVVVSALCAKGILNGVYDLAERLGVSFILPTEAGELLPDLAKPLATPTGKWRINPRFKYRGVLATLQCAKDYSLEDWYRFYAKLRFNAVSNYSFDKEAVKWGKLLGLRTELGGHYLAKLLPRELFDKDPELFRMFQPEDFEGKRNQDSNLCPTNPKAKKIIQKNFAKLLDEYKGVHAIHAWADDLPAGGWCLCPSCRALAPADQAMLSMRHLGEVMARKDKNMRLPMLAYHDTMFPGTQIDAPKNSVLLFAPRERCYAHALNDPSCARNRFYLKALLAWANKYKGIDDAHTLEYYFDQILFRGLYPFLPDTILKDMKIYAKSGIECHLSLQVGGPEIAPEFNMLVYARGHWDKKITARKMFSRLACSLLPQSPKVWEKYLAGRAQIFAEAMKMCGHNVDIYLDYRWLPETTDRFGREMAVVYAKSAAALAAAARELAKSVKAGWPEAAKEMISKEVRRAEFEAQELRVMSQQQTAMNHLGHYHNNGKVEDLKKARAALCEVLAAFVKAKALSGPAGIGETAWYNRYINSWLSRETKTKLERYKQ